MAEPLRLAAGAHVALVGIGQADGSGWLVQQGCITPSEMHELERAGAVGDVLGRFYTVDGKSIHTSLDQRVLGLTLEQVRAIPLVVAVAYGRRKVDAVAGALGGGYLNALITDAETATALLCPRRRPVKGGRTRRTGND